MSDTKSSTGLKLDMILFLIFMTLKLTGYIDWSWWYITMPLWAPVLLLVVVAAIIGMSRAITKS